MDILLGPLVSLRVEEILACYPTVPKAFDFHPFLVASKQSCLDVVRADLNPVESFGCPIERDALPFVCAVPQFLDLLHEVRFGGCAFVVTVWSGYKDPNLHS